MSVIKMTISSGQHCTSLPELMILHSRSFAIVAVVTGFLVENSELQQCAQFINSNSPGRLLANTQLQLKIKVYCVFLKPSINLCNKETSLCLPLGCRPHFALWYLCMAVDYSSGRHNVFKQKYISHDSEGTKYIPTSFSHSFLYSSTKLHKHKNKTCAKNDLIVGQLGLA